VTGFGSSDQHLFLLLVAPVQVVSSVPFMSGSKRSESGHVHSRMCDDLGRVTSHVSVGRVFTNHPHSQSLSVPHNTDWLID